MASRGLVSEATDRWTSRWAYTWPKPQPVGPRQLITETRRMCVERVTIARTVFKVPLIFPFDCLLMPEAGAAHCADFCPSSAGG
ncbi:hypothetical protein I553_7394 [Mycobacterium xenopi 4042]|uniref:Uncharacterized protein n=1 Tax=Mycobacterium xenopi 4042 TaxID=1299334 RepID=X8E971_MYCXE|nr:hypothetical protein I553_7394 [Mycobacterium xenopi 4042]